MRRHSAHVGVRTLGAPYCAVECFASTITMCRQVQNPARVLLKQISNKKERKGAQHEVARFKKE